jgi:2,5-diketo-D-gluconate reductase A
MADVPNITLNNGIKIPQFGLGVFQIPPNRTEQAVLAAFEAGYRHIDTAQMYRNEEEVGRAFARSGLSRDEVFVTTKLHIGRHGREAAISQLHKSLRRLGTDHVDLYLIHWPQPSANRYVETWTGLEQVLADGCTRAIGVSNFTQAHLQRLAAETNTVPAVNQVECHPRQAETRLREYHHTHGIATEAWAPIAQGGTLLSDPTIIDLARKHGKSPAQVVLRWHIQLGNIVFPKSTRPERMRENINVFDFALDDADMLAIAALDVGQRLGPDPDHFGDPSGRLRGIARRVPGAHRVMGVIRAIRSR